MSTSSESRDAPRARRSERGRGPWIVGLVASGVVHLLALVLYSGITFIPTVTVQPPTGRESTLDGIQLIDIAVQAPDEQDESEDETPDPLPPEEPIEQRTAGARPAAGAEPVPDEGVGEDREYVPAAERLRVRAVDPRLFVSDPESQYLGAQELLQLDLDVALSTIRDSIGAAQARAEDALDWTWTDGDGGRWGVSPGKIHLGDITLPLPTSWQMGTSPWNREAELQRQRENAEIDRQAVTGLILQTWEERFRAMRERRDRERAQQSGTPPDTTRFRR
ncbi:MAG TPA: hypothetical protein VJ925_13090 [Longimicrobiales bacterium]|nr:hypothetical protein [Longimicrobiales bacterium]